MMKKTIEEAFCGQTNAELFSGYLYLSMAAWFADQDLPGFSTWMRVQAQEELSHAMKFYDYILERGGAVTLGPVDGPETCWDSPLAAFEAVYAHEQKVTGLIHGLVDLATDEKDHAANLFLQWFVEEQVEEEDSVRTVLAQLKLVADAPGGLYMMDKEMGQRVFTVPSAE